MTTHELLTDAASRQIQYRRCNSLHCGPVRRTAIYRLYDRDERLLYAGIAYDVKKRWREHALDKPWWGDVRWKTALWHDSRLGAAIEEYSAIKYENPQHNKQRDYDRRLGVEPTAAPGKHAPRDWPFWLLTHAMRSRTGEVEAPSELPHIAAVISRIPGVPGDRRRLWFPQIPALGGEERAPDKVDYYGHGFSPSELLAGGFHDRAVGTICVYCDSGEEEFSLSIHHADDCPEPEFAWNPRPPRPTPAAKQVQRAAPLQEEKVAANLVQPSRWKRFWAGVAKSSA